MTDPRPRKDIEADAYENAYDKTNDVLMCRLWLMLEVLLDIRDALRRLEPTQEGKQK